MQSIPNPFLDDVFCGGLSAAGVETVETIHAEALRRLGGHVMNLGGGLVSVMLLRSSRAGCGKSHLLSRLVSGCGGRCFFVPLEVNGEELPSWVGMLQGVLSAAAVGGGGAGGGKISFLDEMSRRLMAEATAELILRGDVPTADPARAIAMLKRDYVGAFDMSGGGSEVARWMLGNFNTLLPLMGEVLGSRAVVDVDEAVAWLRVLSRFAVGNAAERKATLASVGMFGEGDASQAGAKQRLRSFSRLAALHRPLVLVFDHVDGLAAAKRDAMELACVIAEMGRLQFNVGVILSVNGDVWGKSFHGSLPGALEDRLTGREVRLAGIGVMEAEALVCLRMAGAQVDEGDRVRFLEKLRLAEVMARRWAGSATPREVLRHAAMVWERMLAPEGSTVVGGEFDAGESVRDYLPSQLPGGESLAEPSTLRPMREVIRRSSKVVDEPGKEDVGTIKQMGNISSLLRELKSRREQFVPNGGVMQEMAVAPEVVADDEMEGVSPLVKRFHEIREALLRKRGQGLDLEALRRMVTLAGEAFPMIESSEFKMSPGEEPLVSKWVFPGNEILFGFEPEQQFRYWQSLIKLAGRRFASAMSGRLKLVVFSGSEHPFSGVASVDEAELEAGRRMYLDVLDLDAGMIASVTAADRVVCEMAKAEAPVLPVDVVRELAPQLDPLWRRITRPMAAEPGLGEKAV